MKSHRVLAAWLVGTWLLGSRAFGGVAAQSTPTLIANATVIDGTGKPGRAASVRIVNDRIAAVGEITAQPGDQVIDGKGLVLAPGFIDTHSHHTGGLFVQLDAPAVVSQGITTVIAGQDGDSMYPISSLFERLAATPAAMNVASFVGHGALREEVLGKDFKRPATAAEVQKMAELLRAEMTSGALGLSSGLEYDPGIYSETSELVALAKVAAQFGGRYTSHVRSEDRTFWKAIDEAVAIGREARIPVNISHLKLAMRSLWGQTDRLLKTLNDARAAGLNVTADIYPYTYWQSGMTVLFPERNFTDRAAAEFALREVTSAEGLLITRYAGNPAYDGKTLAQIAAARGVDPPQAMMDMIRETDGNIGIVATGMDERDVATLMKWPFANICSDGTSSGGHPRGYGTFPRVLGRYVREQKVLSLEEAIRKMTSLAATNVGLRDRGTVRAGAYADLVLFDAATVIDRSTTKDPKAMSEGIRSVWVNGQLVFDRGKTTDRRPGKVLKRE
jgi:N-acyl-D-amino-acid deacylase